jgi:ribosomal protein L27
MKNEEAVLRMKLSNAKILGQKKWHGTQLTASEVLVYRGTISEPTPWDVSILLIFSFL